MNRAILAGLVLAVASCSGGEGKNGEDLKAGVDSTATDGQPEWRTPDTEEADLGPDAATVDLAPSEVSPAEVEPLDGLQGELETATPTCAEPLSSPGISPLSGYPLDGWQWGNRTVILEPPEETGSGMGYRAPTLVMAQGVYHLYYVHYKTATEWEARHATSTDGVVWSDLGPLTGLAGDAGTLTARYEEGQFRLWHGAGSFSLSVSSDRASFTPVEGSAFGASGAASTFDQWSVLYPAVEVAPEGYALWYTGFDGQKYAIGRATSSDGVVWTRTSPQSVLASGQSDQFDNAAVAQSAVALVKGQYHLWYGGYDTSKTNPGPYRVGLAVSSDGIAWEKKGVSLELSESGPDAYSTRDPAVAPFHQGWLMVYVGMGTDLKYRIMSATSEVCSL